MKREVPVYYLNDRKVPCRVSIGTLHNSVELKPAEGRVFRVLLGMTEIPFIKVWETNVVLISGIDAKAAEKVNE